MSLAITKGSLYRHSGMTGPTCRMRISSINQSCRSCLTLAYVCMYDVFFNFYVTEMNFFLYHELLNTKTVVLMSYFVTESKDSARKRQEEIADDVKKFVK